MALLSLEMIQEIRGVAAAYAARERVRLSASHRNEEARALQPHRAQEDVPTAR